jgi:hypothetical protein
MNSTTGRRARIAGLIGLMLITGLAATACGDKDAPTKTVATAGANGGPSGGPQGDPSAGARGGDPVAYAKCMRDNGVAGFPDPDKNGQIRLDPNTVDQESAEYQKAQEACKQYVGSAAKVRDDPGSQWTIENKLKYAKCMRDNGLANFPDPDKNGQLVLPRSFDPESAQFKAAENACQQYKPQNMPQGGGGAPNGGGPGVPQ